MAQRDRARDLVQHILVFSRQSKVEPKTINPASIIIEALMMLRSSIPSSIEIQQDIAPDCGFIRADPTQLHQIVTNLCINSSHSMMSHGGILRVELKTESDNPSVYLLVSDTGSGIAPEYINKIFDPFFTTKEKSKGTGMGLAIVYSIITELKGRIAVESVLGKGTTFRIYLPKIESQLDAECSKPELVPTFKRLQSDARILLIDDEENIAQCYKELLESFGCRVEATHVCSEALRLFEQHPDNFDLVITDQTMPEMNGMELAAKILAIRPKISIILCTGYSETADENSALQLGIKAFAKKPILLEDFERLLRETL